MQPKDPTARKPNSPAGNGNTDQPSKKSSNSESEGSVISSRQSASIIASTMIGVGVLTLPRVAVHGTNQSGWIGIVIGTAIAMLMTWVISRLGGRFGGQSIVGYGAELLAPPRLKWIGKVLVFPFLLLLLVYWGWASALVARLFGEVVSTTMLPTTPVEVIIVTMLVAGLFMTMYAVEVMARVNEIMLPLIVVPILIIAVSSFQSGRLENLFPLFDLDWKMVMTSSFIMTSTMLGFEVMLLFSANVQQSPHLIRSNMIGVSIPGLLYLLIAIAGISVFGYEELQLLAWPTLELVKTTEVPGLILERLESAFLAVWVTAVFTTLANFYYATALIIKQMFKFSSHRWISVILLPVLYWLAMRPDNLYQLFATQNIIGNMGMVAGLGIPLFFGLVGVLRRGKSEKG
ncbi:GerAB/ArcD/ProY family transporter [Paenibacillus daejeonensis]|uniref:GerAB/ArcD/ProY family transporter n=1 Tax=Paenibacillus daejeonensis TaxID=135193 RepID=UPI000363438B|nr:endospore germination permease [Paenibacillus daejeonensis]